MHEEIARRDWDAAVSLVEEMERAFGYRRSKAATPQGNRRQSPGTGVRKQINETAQVIDKHTRSEQWNAAIREAEKLIERFPDNEQVRNLPHEIDNRRLAHKKQLLQNWHEAVARHDIDGSIEILKLLDPYLTPAEAESMQETVRGVFKEKLNNLGVFFSTARRTAQGRSDSRRRPDRQGFPQHANRPGSSREYGKPEEARPNRQR